LKVARHQTLPNESIDETYAGDHFERRRMGRRRARAVVDLRLGFEQHHRITALSACQRRDDAYRSAAGNDDAGANSISYHISARNFNRAKNNSSAGSGAIASSETVQSD
jgi:hypothetical protein